MSPWSRTLINFSALILAVNGLKVLPPPLKGIGKITVVYPNARLETVIDKETRSESAKWSNSLQNSAYLKPPKRKGLLQIVADKGRLSFLGGNDLQCTLLEGLDASSTVEIDSQGGAFVSFKFASTLSQHDAVMGRIPSAAKLLVHSRIKRWWMAPTFLSDVDEVPVETQLILLEIPLSSPEANYSTMSETNKKVKGDSLKQSFKESAETGTVDEARVKLFSDKSFSKKKYAIIAPLIDFDTGFRTTFYGGKEGGLPAGKGVLAARIESGDPAVRTARVENAVYVAAGNDPYELLEIAYESISKKMGTFRTRKQKLMPPGIDSFGFCTWDAFYSSVDSDKVSSGLDSLSDAGVTVKYVILDDGWQSTALSSKKKDVDEKEKVTDKKSKVLPQLSVISSALQIDTPLQDSKKEVAAAAMTMSASASVVDGEGEDGELSGAQIDGNLAAQKMLEKESSVIVQFFTQAVSNFYTKYVEQGAPDSWPVKLWAGLSQNTILKEKLIEFFDSQTDFSKRLTSWKANSKFENPAKGKTLKGFVKNLKERKGIDYVFVWHALSGYWGGVSTDLSDDLTSALSANRNSASLLSTLSSYPKSTDPARSSINIAAGAIIGGSVGQQSKDPISADKSKAWFTRLRNFRSKVGLAFRPENIQESLQESLPSSAFKDGLLQLSQRILSLTNTSDTAEAVKRSYSRPTPHLLLVEPALAWDPSALVGVGSVAPNKLEEMYERMHSYLADAGIDGVKVDAQSGIGAFGVGNGGGSTIAQACVRAVENSAKRAFSAGNRLKFSEKNALFNLQLQQRVGTLGSIVRRARGLLGLSAQKRAQEVDQGGLLKDSPLALTGCMCHSTENLLNYYETSMARASDDFYPKDMAAQTVHLVSCAYNTVMLGEIATTDWDMFHSKHPFAGMHAAARAISGGPVYVSDSPGNHDPKLLARLVLPDGGILRAQIPARPTVDCLFSDVQKDGATAMKLWSLNKVGAVAGVFNVQGSSWDRKQRRYVQYTPSMMLPVLTAELRPRDIGGPFSALLDTSDESADGTPRVLSQDGKSMLEMFAAWSSKEKKMTILKSRNDAIKFEVQPKGWDVVSLSRILVVPGTQTKVQKIRPITQLKNLFGRILPTRKRSTSSVMSSEGTVESGISASSDVIDYSDAVYWSPIGLLDMLNTGGAVERILPSRSSRSASFLAKGPGRFGVFSSQRPKQVTIDGTVCEFSYEAISRENNKQSIILNDGRGRGINIRLNINAEEMMKEFMQKMGEVSDDVQTFINEASNEYADLMGSTKASDDRSVVQGGLITLLIKSEEEPSSSSPSPPTRLNPLSGVRKIAILW